MKKIHFIILFAGLILLGCRTAQPVIQQYYLLEVPDDYTGTWPEGLSVIPETCEIASVQLAPAYSSHRIALREDSHQIRYFDYNEWAIRPEKAFTQMTLDFFRTHQVFETIKHGRSLRPAGYVLETEVKRVELDLRDDNVLAGLHVIYRLLDGQDGGNVIWSHQAHRTMPLEKKNLNLFAGAVSEMFTEELHAFTIDMMRKIQE